MNKTYGITALGCKVNSYDIQAISETFDRRGYVRSDFESECDVYIINTCSVTNMAESKSRQKIRQAIAKNPNAVICVTGCYAQLSSDAIMAIEGVDIVIGTQHRNSLVNRVDDYFNLNEKNAFVDDIFKTNEYEEITVDYFEKNTRAFVKIQEGCNQFCTYCIIPYARGKMRSRNKDDIIAEIKRLVLNGHDEIVLTGIHTGGYGYDFDDYSFYNLLNDIIINVQNLKRLRISSIEFNQISDEIIDLMVNNNCIVNHLHIPIQSANDQILKAMNRKYTVSEFASKIKYIKNKVKNISITTDLIVGFPGESEIQFKDTYQNLKSIGFSSIHVFPYSIRTGTPAASMPNQISKSDKQMRTNSILTLSNQLNMEFINSQFNEIQSVLLEREIESGVFQGYTSNYIKVQLRDNSARVGDIVYVSFEEVDYPVVKVKKVEV